MTNPDTANTKPSTMDTIKDKAAHVVNKIKGTDDTTTHNTDPTLHTGNHTGNAATATTVPQGNTVERTANDHHRRNELGGMAGGAAAAEGIHHHHDKQFNNQHGITDINDPNHPDHHRRNELGALAGGATVAEGVHHHHDRERDLERERALHQQQSGTGATTGVTGGLAHPAPADTKHIPTYAQNIPPMAAGTVPTAHVVGTQGNQGINNQRPVARDAAGMVGGAAAVEGIHHHHHHHHDKDLAREQENQAAAVGVNAAMQHQGGGILPHHNQQHTNEAATLATGGAPAAYSTNPTSAAGGPVGTTAATGTQMPGQYGNRPVA